VKVYDIRGRLLDSNDLGMLTATGPQTDPETEPHLWIWQPAEGGPGLPAGVYWVEFTGSGARSVRKITFIH
jgi:hypothetical protein